MRRSPGVRLCATAAMGTLSVALVTGCSGSGTRNRVPNAATLDRLVMAEGELPGYEIRPTEPGTTAGDPPTSAEAACRPLLPLLAGTAPGTPAAQVSRTAAEKGAPETHATALDGLSEGELKDAVRRSMDRDVTVITLASYGGDGAHRALRSVSGAVRACADGFGGTGPGERRAFSAFTPEHASDTGEESVAFAATGGGSASGDTAGEGSVHFQVVRHGSTLATYMTMNVGAMMARRAYAVPARVIGAQSAKLR
ncbi:hypothetical protein GTW40_25380 [Streptomyces sp. SID4985]|uniref:hypothetical protein n=1 Tax=Streptomyces sp. SID4985 TaxID=2690292 RepID=UPI00136CDCC5|nr:hypothetical protein [Streptomyces sp. SID4985]MYQ48330.1 hypothetical protein [Streptomyces sp. SID4985]